MNRKGKGISKRGNRIGGRKHGVNALWWEERGLIGDGKEFCVASFENKKQSGCG